MTKLEYLNNPYLFESKSVFVEIKELNKGKAVILDKTIFYPQGGGQPADKGKIISNNVLFLVTDVRMDEEGQVWHFGEAEKGIFRKGEEATLRIEQDRRILNSRLHSAGHLLDCAVLQAGIKNLKPVKGFHFPEGPYVEYEGAIESPDEATAQLQKILDDLVSKNLKIEVSVLSSREAEKQGFNAFPGKPVCLVRLEGFSACGCGGTHVNSSSEIGKNNRQEN